MSEPKFHAPLRPGQRWSLRTDLAEFERALVILARNRSDEGGDRFEVAVAFAPDRHEAPAQSGGTTLALGEDGLRRSVLKLLEEDVAPSDVRLAMRLDGCVHFTDGSVDDGLREYLAAMAWSAGQQREARQGSLHFAVEQGDPDAVRRLAQQHPAQIEAPAPPDWPETPLALAARLGQIEAARALLDAGATAGAVSADGATPLHHAARHGQPEIAALLLERRADVDAADSRGETPLLAAARSLEPEARRVAELLEDAGAAADLNVLVSLGRIDEVRRRLRSQSSCPEPTGLREEASLPDGVLDDAVAAIRRAILARTDPGIEDPEVIEAAVGEYLPLVEVLLDAGADPNAGFGLWAAVQLPDPRPARLLLERGADPNKDLVRGYFLPEIARHEVIRGILHQFGAKGRDDPELVVARETENLAEQPEDAAAWKRRAAAHQQLGRAAEALTDWEQVLLLAPEDPDAYCARAWIWAASPAEALRDGPAAVHSAARAVELDAGSAVLWDEDAGRARVRCEYRETLAAAHAECGQFNAAVQVLDELLEVASVEDRPRIRYRRALFASGRPYRDLPGADDPALYGDYQDLPEKEVSPLLVWVKGLLSRLRGNG